MDQRKNVKKFFWIGIKKALRFLRLQGFSPVECSSWTPPHDGRVGLVKLSNDSVDLLLLLGLARGRVDDCFPPLCWMNGLPPASHSQPAHKMYTAGSLELHRGVEIQLCKLTHKHRNIYQLCTKLLSCCLYGRDTFIALLSLARNHNATFTVVDHWDAYLGLRLTTLVLYGTLTCRPN